MRAGTVCSAIYCRRCKERQVFRCAAGCRLDRFLGKTTIMVRLMTMAGPFGDIGDHPAKPATG